MEFKGTRLEKLSVFFSIYLLFSLSMALFTAAEETKPFSGTITIKNIHDPRNLEVIPDKYSLDALTVVELDIETCEAEVSCGGAVCEIPYSEVVEGGPMPIGDTGKEEYATPMCGYINDEGEHITLVVDLMRWTGVAIKSISDTEVELYLIDQREYNIAYFQTQGDVTVYTIQHAGRLKETVGDVASVETVLCSADLLGEAKIECNKQTMETYAIVATYMHFIRNILRYVWASLRNYEPNSICNILGGLLTGLSGLEGIFSGKYGKYGDKLGQYSDKISGLTGDALELYNKISAYITAAKSCKEAYEYVKDFYDGITELYGKFEKYIGWFDSPFPACVSELKERTERIQGKLSGIQNKFNGIIDKLKDLYPDCLLDLDGLLEQLKNIIPDCIQSLLDKIDVLKGLIERLKVVLSAYCSKVQTMKQYYGDPAKGNNPEMAQKYGELYEICDDGKWDSLFGEFDKLPPAECVNLKSAITLPEGCQESLDIDFIALPGISEFIRNLIPNMELPGACTDAKALLKDMLLCGVDLDFKDIPEDEPVSC